MLRDYQIELTQKLRNSIKNGNKRIVAVLPTGGGKTFTFSNIIKGAVDRGRKTLILTDRIELMKQAGGSLKAFDLNPIEIKAGANPYLGGNSYVAMVETLFRRIEKKEYQFWLDQMDVIIIDECHMRAFDKLLPIINNNTRILGFTATPRRDGKKDLLGDYYTDICVGVEIPYLIEKGFLSKPTYFGMQANLDGVNTVRGDYDQNQVADRFSKAKLYKGVKENYERIASNTKTLIFSSNIESSKELVQEFQGKARHLDSKMRKKEREEILDWFHRTPDAILSNVGILTKGFDEPSIQTVILYRATKSLPLYLQMVGRGSRTTATKKEFTVMDFGNNIHRHGFWDEVRPWQLQSSSDILPVQREAVLKTCKNPACEMFIPAATVTCPHCGHVDEREKEEQEFAKLQMLTPKQARTMASTQSIEERVRLAKLKIIKPYWVLHNVKDFEEANTFVRLMGWNPHWFEHNHSRFKWSNEYLERRNNGKVTIKI